LLRFVFRAYFVMALYGAVALLVLDTRRRTGKRRAGRGPQGEGLKQRREPAS
jgi:hypothetical protein